MRNKALRVLLLGISTLCLCFSMACSGSPNDKYLNKKYEMNSFESNTYRDGLAVSGTIDQVATEFTSNPLLKGKTYMFSLGFLPTTYNIAEFEQILRNDFDGEIEILHEGKPYSIINYNDFDSFAWSPGKDAYGPVYYFSVSNSSGVAYSFKPKIRAKEACAYSFNIQRVRRSFGKPVNDLIKSPTKDVRKQNTKKGHEAKNEMINIPAIMRRIDMDIEKDGGYTISLGLRFPMQFTIDGKRDYIKELSINDKLMKDGYDGTIKVHKNGNPYLIIRYDDNPRSNSGNNRWWGGHDSKTTQIRWYSFYADEPGTYSFIPEMKSNEKFDFSLSINYIYWRM